MRIRIARLDPPNSDKYRITIYDETPASAFFRPEDYTFSLFVAEQDLDMIQAALDLARSGSIADLRSPKGNLIRQYDNENMHAGQFIYSPKPQE